MASTSTPHICVVGSLNLDFVTFAPRCPDAGETLTATSMCITAGGKGANQAVACGRASFASISKTQQDVLVSMIGAVGVDDLYYSTLLRPALDASGVNTKNIEQRTDSKTGSATIIVEGEAAGAENRILVVPGANHAGMMDVENILSTMGKLEPRPGVLVMQGEIPRSTVLALLQHFNNSDGDIACKTHVIFNPAPVFPEGIPLAALANTPILIMNETEAVQMMRSIAKIPMLVRNEADLRLEELTQHFHKIAKVAIVLITLGSKGVFWSVDTGRQGVIPGVRAKKVVDTTAAGDTFVGYLATTFAKFVATGASLADFESLLEKAIQDANAAAAVCVQRRGAMQSIPFAYEL